MNPCAESSIGIDAQANRGYALRAPCDLLDADRDPRAGSLNRRARLCCTLDVRWIVDSSNIACCCAAKASPTRKRCWSKARAAGAGGAGAHGVRRWPRTSLSLARRYAGRLARASTQPRRRRRGRRNAALIGMAVAAEMAERPGRRWPQARQPAGGKAAANTPRRRAPWSSSGSTCMPPAASPRHRPAVDRPWPRSRRGSRVATRWRRRCCRGCCRR